MEIYLPDQPLGAPSVVLVHGGGWVAGTPGSTASLAKSLSDAGAIVFNASYRTALTGGGYPATFDDVACAVRFARSRLGELGGSGELILAGHSAGAHISAVVALSEDAFGPDCPWEGSSTPERFVGLAGLYEIDAVAPVMDVFLGGDRSEAPDAWEAADPFAHLDAAAGMDMTLVHGTDDAIVPAAASRAVRGRSGRCRCPSRSGVGRRRRAHGHGLGGDHHRPDTAVARRSIRWACSPGAGQSGLS